MTPLQCRSPARRRSAAVTAVCLASVLGACTTPQTRVYSLDTPPPTAPAPGVGTAVGTAAGAAIRVDALSVPPALDRSEIVSDEAPGRLHIHELDHWPAPLGEAARQALSADLDSRLAPGRLIFPHLPKPRDALGLSVDILSFHRDRGVARLEAGWVILVPGADPLRRTVTLRREDAGSPSAHGAGAAAETAAALSGLLADLADQIAASLPADGVRNSTAAARSDE